MEPPGKIEDLLEHWYKKLSGTPEELHLLCPKVDEEDGEDYDDLTNDGVDITVEEKIKRVQDGKDRLEIAYWTSLLVAYGKDKAGIWLTNWGQRMARNLHNCDKCVLNWHMARKAYLQKFSEKWEEDIVVQLENCLHAFDFQRIDKGLEWAQGIIDKVEGAGRAFSRSDLGEEQGSVLLTVYEALCCMPYLSLPDKRHLFQYVFLRLSGKKPLKLGDNVLLPAMTTFLFDDEPTRLKFAARSWERIRPKSLTEEQFNWAVRENLEVAIRSVAQYHPVHTESYPEIQRFWEGLNWILKALNENLVLHGIRSMEVKPSIYDLLFQHMRCNSEAILLYVIQALTALLQTSSQAFWDALGDARPFLLVDEIFKTPLMKPLLSQSLSIQIQSDSGSSESPFTTSWINTWLHSLKRNQKNDACEQLLNLLFGQVVLDPGVGEQGQAACIRAGLDALDHVLRSFLDPSVKVTSGTTSVYINSMLNVTLKYKDVINAGAETTSPTQHTLGVPLAASNVIGAALALDSRATAEEHWELHKTNPMVQNAVLRHSSELWEAFLENLYNGKLELAKTMILSMVPLINVEKFRPDRKKPLSLTADKKSFNAEFGKTVEVLGRVIQRLGEFTKEDLAKLCLNAQSIRPLLAFTLHGEDEISDASGELIKIITGETSRSDAMLKLLHDQLNTTLSSVVFAIRRIIESPHPPWGPMRHILNTSRDIIRGLCDPSTGILRSRPLNQGEQVAVTGWWMSQWKYIELAFENTMPWSHQVEIVVMQDFCREVIELADALLAQDGLISSALQQQTGPGSLSRASDGADAVAGSSTMKTLLQECKRRLMGIVSMIRLRDKYLVGVTVNVISKLLGRLRENDIDIPPEPKSFVQDACIPTLAGKYQVGTNLNDQQRAELLKALGEDEDVQIVQIVPKSEKPKKQSTIDAWSKAGSSGTSTPSSVTSRTNRDDVRDLSSSIDSNRSLLDRISARQAPKPVKQRVDAKALTGSALIEARKREKAEKAKRDAEAIAKAKALREPTVTGEGSGLKGLAGVVGKNHAPMKNDIMVDSDEDEDEDSDSGDDLTALIDKGQRGQTAVDEAAKRRQRQLLEKTRGPVKKVKLQRSAKDMRARLIPPMDTLHQAILEWDIFHAGHDPPNFVDCTQVANTYEHPGEYKGTFFNLLISEAWRSFVTAKDETTSKPYGIKIASRMNVDKFLEVTASTPSAENKERKLAEGDIILISMSSSPLTDTFQPHALARIWKINYKKGLAEVTYRLHNKNNPLQSNLAIGCELNAVKITNMTTIEREYAALESLQYYDLMIEVLKAEPSPVLKYGDEAVHGVVQNYKLNPAQARAILGARDNDGFTLIQGPPGTGKTKTIVAMVGALLTGNIQPSGQSIARLPGHKPNNQGGMMKKLLVCAPSNAAVDELVLRLKQGVKTMTGSFHKINVLRLGRSDAINAAVRDVTLDEMVRARLDGDNTRNQAQAARDKMHEEAVKIRDQLALLRPELDAARGSENRTVYFNLQRTFDTLKRDQARIGARIDADKESGNTTAREVEIRRRQIQQEILDSAQVLCATLSGSGHEMFKNLNVEFETVIIDEAAQCVELSALIPLKYGCTKCILVGDPKQLPPTVLSQSAARFGYDQSLFVRMQRNHPGYIHMLDRQYRMHPEISMFPSLEFYEGLLVDGDDMGDLRRQPWHASSLLGPYRFFDVEGTQERGHRGQSLVNVEELRVAMQLYERFSTDFGRQQDIRGKIGIITPYKAQLNELRNRFTSRYGDDITEKIEFNTTDAFQGRECEIIIFSCVRASATGGIGFMQDIRRMNVGLTRAKSSLWILGDSRALVQGEFWAKLIDNARNRNLYTKGNILSMLSKPSQILPQARNTSSAPKPSLSENAFSDSPRQQVLGMPDAISTLTLSEPAPTHQSRPQAVVPKPSVPNSTSSAIPSGPSWTKEVVVTEAEELPRPSSRRTSQPQPQQLPSAYTVAERPVSAWETERRIGRLNEMGEAEPVVSRHVSRPVILSTADLPQKPESKKRPRDANDDAGLHAKRVANEMNRAHNPANPIPIGPRAMSAANTQKQKQGKTGLLGQIGMKTPKALKTPPVPTDPSAMVALGLVPPTRPSPPTTTTAASLSGTPSGHSSNPNRPNTNQLPEGAGQSLPRIPKKKKADPFIQKKHPRR